jgi:hypothetical protein
VRLALTAIGVGLATETGPADAAVADGDAVAANGDTEASGDGLYAGLAAGEGLPAGVGLPDGVGLAATLGVAGCGLLAVAPFTADVVNDFSLSEFRFLFSTAGLFDETRG